MPSHFEQLRNTPPRSTNTAWLGIDVGTCGVKIAEVVRDGLGWRPTSSVFLPIAPQAGFDQRSLQEGRLGHLLTRELGAAGPLGRNAAVVLSMSCVDYRSFDLPIASEEERDLMVQQELEEAGTEASIAEHWRCGPSSKHQHEMEEVDVVSLKPQIARAVIDDLLSCGVACQVIDGLPFVLARASQMVAAARSGPVAMLDWGFSTPTFTVVDHGVPVFTRCLRDCGLRRAAEALADRLQLSLGDSAQLLSAAGRGGAKLAERPTGLNAAIDASLHSIFDAISQEVSKTLSYLAQHCSPAVAVEHVLLTGGGGSLPRVEERLTQEIGRDVRCWQLGASEARPAADDAFFASAYALSALGDAL